jgi:hypothetical protein
MVFTIGNNPLPKEAHTGRLLTTAIEELHGSNNVLVLQPLFFMLSSVIKTTRIFLEALPKPTILTIDPDNLSNKTTIVCNEGESAFFAKKRTSPKHSNRKFLSTNGMNGCIFAYIYNDNGESFSMHYNGRGKIEWKQIFDKFIDKNIQVTLIGGRIFKGRSDLPDLGLELILSLYNYSQFTDPKIKVNISSHILDQRSTPKSAAEKDFALFNFLKIRLNDICKALYFKDLSEIIDVSKASFDNIVEKQNPLSIDFLEYITSPDSEEQILLLKRQFSDERNFKSVIETIFSRNFFVINEMHPAIVDVRSSAEYCFLSDFVIDTDNHAIIPVRFIGNKTRQSYSAMSSLALDSMDPMINPPLLEVFNSTKADNILISPPINDKFELACKNHREKLPQYIDVYKSYNVIGMKIILSKFIPTEKLGSLKGLMTSRLFLNFIQVLEGFNNGDLTNPIDFYSSTILEEKNSERLTRDSKEPKDNTETKGAEHTVSPTKSTSHQQTLERVSDQSGTESDQNILKDAFKETLSKTLKPIIGLHTSSVEHSRTSKAEPSRST